MVKFALFYLAIACLMAGVGLLLRAYDKKCGTKRGGKGGRKGLLAFSAMAVLFALLGSSAAVLAQDPLRGLTAEEVRLLHNEDADGNQLPPGEADRQLKAIYTPEFWARERAIVAQRERGQVANGRKAVRIRTRAKATSSTKSADCQCSKTCVCADYGRACQCVPVLQVSNAGEKRWMDGGPLLTQNDVTSAYDGLIYAIKAAAKLRDAGDDSAWKAFEENMLAASAPRTVCDGNTCRVVNDGPPAAGACSSGSCAAGPVRRVFANQPVRGALRRIFCR